MLKVASATSGGPSLSKAWEATKAHRGAYRVRRDIIAPGLLPLDLAWHAALPKFHSCYLDYRSSPPSLVPKAPIALRLVIPFSIPTYYTLANNARGGKVQLSSDGTFLACLYDDDVSFVDVEEGVVTERLKEKANEGSEEAILSFVLHPGGREIVTASRSQLLRHWDLETGECKRAIRAREHVVLCMEYDGTGTLVATGGSDHTVKVWDVEKGYCTHNFRGHRGIVSVLAFHPDPKRLVLVSGSEDTTVRVWDLTKQSCTAVLEAHLSYVTSMAFFSGGAALVTGGRDRVLNFWDLKSGDLRKTFPVYEEVEGLQVLPEGSEEMYAEGLPDVSCASVVAVAGKTGVVRVFSVGLKSDEGMQGDKRKTGKGDDVKGMGKGKSNTLAAPDTQGKVICRCVATQDNGSASHKVGYTELLQDPARGGLVAVTADHNLMLLEPAPAVAGARGALALVTKRQIVGYNDEVIDIKSLPKGIGSHDHGDSWVAVATNSPQVRLFELGGFSCRLLDGHTDTVLALDVAPDGRHLCTSSKDRACLLWDIELGVPVIRWSGHADAVGAVAASRKLGPWSPTNTSSSAAAFVVSGAADRTLQRWEIPHRALAKLETEARESWSKAAAAATAKGHEGTDVLKGDGDSSELSSARGSVTGKVKPWRPPAPLLETSRRSVRAHEQDINCVAVAPNDAVVASASQDRTVKLWRASDLELLGVLKGHRRGVWKVEFSPVDKCVATCSGDRTVKVWSVADFSCLRTFQGHTASVLSVVFVSAGAQLISGGADGLLKVWTLRSDECEATIDAHNDKIWALTTATAPRQRNRVDGADGEEGGASGREGPNEGLVVVSGGADSEIKVLSDVTAREEEKAIAEKEVGLLKEQELFNRLREKDYGPAIALALELKRPQRLWGVLRDAMTEGMGEDGDQRVPEEAGTEMASRRLDEHVASWSMDTIAQCLGYCRDWNTNARKAVVVHALVASILRCVSLASLKTLPGVTDLVQALLAYSERHFQRLEKLLQNSYLAEHTLASMEMLMSDEIRDERASEERSAAPQGAVARRSPKQLPKLPAVHGAEGSSSDDEADRQSHHIPVTEVIDGRVVHNVPLEAVDGASDGESSDDDGGSDRSEDVKMHDAVGGGLDRETNSTPLNGLVPGHEDKVGSKARVTKKKRKRPSTGEAVSGDGMPPPPLPGLLGQPPVQSYGSARTPAVADGSGDATSDVREGKAKKRTRKRRNSESVVMVADSSEKTPVVVVEKQTQSSSVDKGIREMPTGEPRVNGPKRKKRTGKGRRKSSAT